MLLSRNGIYSVFSNIMFLNLEIEIDEESDFGAFGHEEDPKHSDDDLEPHSLQRSVIKGLDEEDLYPF